MARKTKGENKSKGSDKEHDFIVAAQEEHKWLMRLLGNWKFESECNMGPDQPPVNTSAVESVHSLGELWTVCQISGTMPDGHSVESIMTLGYDPARKRFVGSFVSSCMANIWVYDGKLNAERTVLTLDAEGPDFSDPAKLAKYQDIIEFQDDNHRTLRSRFLTPDGQWNEFMLARYTRT